MNVTNPLAGLQNCRKVPLYVQYVRSKSARVPGGNRNNLRVKSANAECKTKCDRIGIAESSVAVNAKTLVNPAILVLCAVGTSR